MNNPWLEIPLADYEGHMSLPNVGQARLLAVLFESLLREYLPRSVAVIGCAGGNGFERIAPDVTTRVVGVDINPAYIEKTRARFSGRFGRLELHAGDIQYDRFIVEPVALIYAALVFEYVNLSVTLAKLASMLEPGGVLATVVQLRCPAVDPVTPSKFRRLQLLAPVMRTVPPEDLRTIAESAGFAAVSCHRTDLPSGKAFQAQVFRLLDSKQMTCAPD